MAQRKPNAASTRWIKVRFLSSEAVGLVSAKVEYAALAILELAARAGNDQPVPLRDLADSQQIPAQFLVQLLQRLKVAGLVRSTRGAAGGYLLARLPAEITMWDVWAAVAVEESAPSQAPQGSRRAALNELWDQVLEDRRAKLSGITIEAMLLRCQDTKDPMYYI